MDASVLIAGLAVVISLAAVVATTVLARRQLSQDARAQMIPVVQLLDELRDPEYRSILDYVEERLAHDNPPSGGSYSVPRESWARIRPLVAYFNHIGMLVYVGSLRPEVVSSIMGGSVKNAWSVLAPYIYDERERRGGDPVYYGYFEHLAALLAEYGPHDLETILGLRAAPPKENASPDQGSGEGNTR